MRRTQYTRAQVLGAERVSWTEPRGDDEDRYSYDGISFWRHQRDGGRQLTREGAAPSDGWRHEDDCNCALCREAWAVSGPNAKQAFIA